MLKREMESKEAQRRLEHQELRSVVQPTKIEKLRTAVLPPVNVLPPNSLPGWKDYPLEKKFPIVPSPNGEFSIARNAVGESIFVPGKCFDLEDPLILATPRGYQSLHDPNLKSYFLTHPDVFDKLHQQGLIEADGSVKAELRDYNVYRAYLARLKNCVVKKDIDYQDNLASAQRGQLRTIAVNDARAIRAVQEEKKARHLENLKRERQRQELAAQLKDVRYFERSKEKERQAVILAVKREALRDKVRARMAQFKKAERRRAKKMIIEWYCKQLYADMLRKARMDHKREEREQDLVSFVQAKREFQEKRLQWLANLQRKRDAERECEVKHRVAKYDRMETGRVERMKLKAMQEQAKARREVYLQRKFGMKWLKTVRQQREYAKNYHDSVWRVRQQLVEMVHQLRNESGKVNFTSFIKGLISMKPGAKKSIEMSDETRGIMNYILDLLIQSALETYKKQHRPCDKAYNKLGNRRRILGERELTEDDFRGPEFTPREKVFVPFLKPGHPCHPNADGSDQYPCVGEDEDLYDEAEKLACGEIDRMLRGDERAKKPVNKSLASVAGKGVGGGKQGKGKSPGDKKDMGKGHREPSGKKPTSDEGNGKSAIPQKKKDAETSKPKKSVVVLREPSPTYMSASPSTDSSTAAERVSKAAIQRSLIGLGKRAPEESDDGSSTVAENLVTKSIRSIAEIEGTGGQEDDHPGRDVGEGEFEGAEEDGSGEDYGDGEGGEGDYGDGEGDEGDYGDEVGSEEDYQNEADEGEDYGDAEGDEVDYEDEKGGGKGHRDGKRGGKDHGDGKGGGKDHGDEEGDGVDYGDEEGDGVDYGDDEGDEVDYGDEDEDSGMSRDPRDTSDFGRKKGPDYDKYGDADTDEEEEEGSGTGRYEGKQKGRESDGQEEDEYDEADDHRPSRGDKDRDGVYEDEEGEPDLVTASGTKVGEGHEISETAASPEEAPKLVPSSVTRPEEEIEKQPSTGRTESSSGTSEDAAKLVAKSLGDAVEGLKCDEPEPSSSKKDSDSGQQPRTGRSDSTSASSDDAAKVTADAIKKAVDDLTCPEDESVSQKRVVPGGGDEEEQQDPNQKSRHLPAATSGSSDDAVKAVTSALKHAASSIACDEPEHSKKDSDSGPQPKSGRSDSTYASSDDAAKVTTDAIKKAVNDLTCPEDENVFQKGFIPGGGDDRQQDPNQKSRIFPPATSGSSDDAVKAVTSALKHAASSLACDDPEPGKASPHTAYSYGEPGSGRSSGSSGKDSEDARLLVSKSIKKACATLTCDEDKTEEKVPQWESPPDNEASKLVKGLPGSGDSDSKPSASSRSSGSSKSDSDGSEALVDKSIEKACTDLTCDEEEQKKKLAPRRSGEKLDKWQPKDALAQPKTSRSEGSSQDADDLVDMSIAAASKDLSCGGSTTATPRSGGSISKPSASSRSSGSSKGDSDGSEALVDKSIEKACTDLTCDEDEKKKKLAPRRSGEKLDKWQPKDAGVHPKTSRSDGSSQDADDLVDMSIAGASKELSCEDKPTATPGSEECPTDPVEPSSSIREIMAKQIAGDALPPQGSVSSSFFSDIQKTLPYSGPVFPLNTTSSEDASLLTEQALNEAMDSLSCHDKLPDSSSGLESTRLSHEAETAVKRAISRAVDNIEDRGSPGGMLTASGESRPLSSGSRMMEGGDVPSRLVRDRSCSMLEIMVKHIAGDALPPQGSASSTFFNYTEETDHYSGPEFPVNTTSPSSAPVIGAFPQSRNIGTAQPSLQTTAAGRTERLSSDMRENVIRTLSNVQHQLDAIRQELRKYGVVPKHESGGPTE